MSAPTVVIGVGNPLMGDDGLGLAVLSALREEWRIDPPVELVDGGTWGMNLLPIVEDAGRLLVLDAIDVGAPPGTPVVLRDGEIPRALLAGKVSPHQVDLREVLALAELRSSLPAELVAVGVQPDRVELGMELSPRVQRSFDAMLGLALARLERWGHRVEREAAPCTS